MNGNYSSVITKVISEPGDTDDFQFELCQNTKSDKKAFQRTVLCEAKAGKSFPTKHNNKNAYREAISDLRPATEDEKFAYRKGIYFTKWVKGFSNWPSLLNGS